MELQTIYFPLFALWALSLLLVLVRRGVGGIWKVAIFMISLFYMIWFESEITASALFFRDHTDQAVVGFLGSVMDLTGLVLMILWPAVLLLGYFAASPLFHQKIVRNFAVLTLFYWMFWMGGFFFQGRPTRWIKSHLPGSLPFLKSSSPPAPPASGGR